MEDPGQKLKQARERLGLRFREVQEASEKIAEKRKSDKYAMVINSLSDIENRGLVPTLHKLYSLCAIYRLDMDEVMEWYGIERGNIPEDSELAPTPRTHLAHFDPGDRREVRVPLSLDPGIDMSRTTFLSRMIQRWGRLPLIMLQPGAPEAQRYGFVGADDWFMYPLLQPGALLLIDDTKKRVTSGPWSSEWERPIYLVEHRGGYVCGWCVLENDTLTLLPHPLSGCSPISFPWPQEADIIGQVVGIAMRLDQGRKRHTHSAAEP